MTAGLLRRLAAALYESLLVAAIVLIAGFALAPLVAPGRASGTTTLVAPGLVARGFQFGALFTLLAAYFVWSWSAGRRTLPMKTWHLALVTAAGGPLPQRIALARFLAAWIGPALAVLAYAASHNRWSAVLVAANYGWAWIDRDGAFLHDRIAGTRLIERPDAA